MLLNLGPTRADSIPDIVKLDVPSGAIMQEVASSVMCVFLIPVFVMWRMMVILTFIPVALMREQIQ